MTQMNDLLLSVIIPIYNGSHIIDYTLSLLKEQIVRNSDSVELIICNNASTDKTVEILENINGNEPFFRVVNYVEHVGIGESISRSIENATGTYTMLWSDDDIPGPTMIDTVLLYLKKYPNISCAHFNRLTGYTSEGNGIGSLRVYNNVIKENAILYDDIEKFAVDHYQGMDFMSCDVIRTNAWKRGLEVYDKRHCGYEFIVPMLYGSKDGNCLYINFPLCVHRASHRARWIIKAPLYWFVGAPRMIKDMERLGIIRNWKAVWGKSYYFDNSLRSYISIMLLCTLDKKLYKSVLKELCDYQNSIIRKIFAYMIVYLCPTALYSWLQKKKFGKHYVKDSNGSLPLVP